MDVAAFVNGGTSTSFQLELSAKIDELTPANVNIVSFYDNSFSDADPDVAQMDLDFIPLGASSRFDFDAYRKLRTLVSDFDVLHTHYNFVGSAGRLASVGTDTKIVNTEHTDHHRLSHLQNGVNAPTYPAIDVMVYNSRSTRDSMRWYERPLLRWSDCQVVHNGIDFDRLKAGQSRSDLPELPDGPKIVTAARLVPVKNIETLIQAMQPILTAVPEAELVIIGDGPEESTLQQQASKIGVSESTTFLGRLEREQVYGTISRCDVFAVSSLNEGFCNAAVEAMGCGLPVVASDIDVLHEVVGEGGLFADPTEPEAFAEQLLKLLTDPEFQKRLGNTAKSRASSEFTIEKSAQRYYKIYRSLIEQDDN